MKNRNSIMRLLWSIAILQFVFLVGCQKYSDKDFNPNNPPPSEGSGVLKFAGGNLSINGDTLKAPADFVIKFWVDSLPPLPSGYVYLYYWSLGDGSPAVTKARIEHKFVTGLYQLSVTITNPINGNVIVKNMWIKISPLYGQDNTIRVISATQVSGGYDYLLGFLANTIAGFAEPPYTSSNIPFVTGTFCDWQLNPPPSNPDYTYIDGVLYLTRHIIFANYTPQDLQFGQLTNWSYNTNSIYWVSTGGQNGKYVIYPLNGQIYNFSPGTSYFPGENGDYQGGQYPPTVRDSLILGSTPQVDSLQMFINYQQYANGPQPFIAYTKLDTWYTAPLHIIGVTGWGYFTLSVPDIMANNGKLYFKFGPNLPNPTNYGDMTKTKFYIPLSFMCGLQLAPVKSSRGYTITKI